MRKCYNVSINPIDENNDIVSKSWIVYRNGIVAKLAEDLVNPNTNRKKLTTLTSTLTDPRNAFESFCAPIFCDIIRNYPSPTFGLLDTS